MYNKTDIKRKSQYSPANAAKYCLNFLPSRRLSVFAVTDNILLKTEISILMLSLFLDAKNHKMKSANGVYSGRKFSTFLIDSQRRANAPE